MDVSKKITTILEGMKMKNYTKISVGQDARTELHDQLGLTGAEISVNNLPAGAGIPTYSSSPAIIIRWWTPSSPISTCPAPRW